MTRNLYGVKSRLQNVIRIIDEISELSDENTRTGILISSMNGQLDNALNNVNREIKSLINIKKLLVTDNENYILDLKNNQSTGITNGTRNLLLRAGYNNLLELSGMTRREIVSIKGMGEKRADEIIKACKVHDVTVVDD